MRIRFDDPRDVLATREARWIAGAGSVGRLREAGVGLALILVVRDDGGSFATAGLASAAYLAAGAVTRPAHGRWVDRRGARRPLLIASGANAAALMAVAIAAWSGAGDGILIGLSAVVGATLPALSATLRAVWPRVTPGRDAHAYALDTLSYELSLVAAPAMVAGIAVVGSAPLALVAIAGLGLGGTAVVATRPAARAPFAAADDPRRRSGPSTAVRSLIAVSLFVGATEGTMTVLAPGLAAARGERALSGVLLSCLATASIAGVVAYGAMLAGRGSVSARLVVAGAGLAAAAVALALLGTTFAGFAVGAAAVGLTLAPTLTLVFTAIRHTARPGSLTEVFTWASFAASAGAAGSQALAGLLIARDGVPTALWLTPALACAAAIAATAHRLSARWT